MIGFPTQLVKGIREVHLVTGGKIRKRNLVLSLLVDFILMMGVVVQVVSLALVLLVGSKGIWQGLVLTTHECTVEVVAGKKVVLPAEVQVGVVMGIEAEASQVVLLDDPHNRSIRDLSSRQMVVSTSLIIFLRINTNPSPINCSGNLH